MSGIPAFVVGFAFANRLAEVLMFVVVRVALASAAFGNSAAAFGSANVFINCAPGAGDVTALRVHLFAVCIGEFDKVMVEDFAVVDAVLTNFASAHGVGGNRVIHLVALAEEPVADVQVVNVLFANVVAAEPVEVIPVAHLIVHFGLPILTSANPNASAVPVNVGVNQIAVLVVFANGFEARFVVALMVSLKTNADSQAFFVCQFVNFHEHFEAGGVNAAGFFHEDVIAFFDSVFIMNWAESRRRGENGVTSAVFPAVIQRLFEPVKTPEDGILLQSPAAASVLGGIRKCVRASDNLSIRGGKEVTNSAASATAAADQNGFNGFIGSFAVRQLSYAQGHGSCGSR